MGANPDVNFLHSHPGGLNWPPYGSAEYPEYLQSAKFNLIANSNFIKRVYKHCVFQMKDGSKIGPLNFDSQVACNGINSEEYKFKKEKAIDYFL